MVNAHSVYGLGQWGEALLCNTFSHWLSPYTEDPWNGAQSQIACVECRAPIQYMPSYLWRNSGCGDNRVRVVNHNILFAQWEFLHWYMVHDKFILNWDSDFTLYQVGIKSLLSRLITLWYVNGAYCSALLEWLFGSGAGGLLFTLVHQQKYCHFAGNIFKCNFF